MSFVSFAVALILLLLALLSLGDLPLINADNNQQQAIRITNKPVNQSTLPTVLRYADRTVRFCPTDLSRRYSTVVTEMKWIKTLKNRTEDSGRTVLLECQVKSTYPVTFTWYRYNNPLERKQFTVDEHSSRSR